MQDRIQELEDQLATLAEQIAEKLEVGPAESDVQALDAKVTRHFEEIREIQETILANQRAYEDLAERDRVEQEKQRQGILERLSKVEKGLEDLKENFKDVTNRVVALEETLMGSSLSGTTGEGSVLEDLEAIKAMCSKIDKLESDLDSLKKETAE